MNCFNHPEKVSVGICRACSKGLCKECAVDLPAGLSCQGDHEDLVTFLRQNITESKYVTTARNIYLAPAFFIVLGILYIWFFRADGPADFGFMTGLVFIMFGCVIFVRSRNLVKAGNTRPK